MRLLLTRPLPDAERTAAALRSSGHSVVTAPLLHIQPIADAEIGAGPWAAILITSANAAHALARHGGRDALLPVPVFAVGERSAQAIGRVGFTSVTSAGSDANDLAALIGARLQPPARLLYLAGEERSGDLAGALREKGFAVDTVAIYRAVAAEKFPQTAVDALASGLDGVLHYSRRSAQAYINAARQGDMLAKALGLTHYCLSAQIAQPLAAAGAARVAIASRPSEAALLALIG